VVLAAYERVVHIWRFSASIRITFAQQDEARLPVQRVRTEYVAVSHLVRYRSEHHLICRNATLNLQLKVRVGRII